MTGMTGAPQASRRGDADPHVVQTTPWDQRRRPLLRAVLGRDVGPLGDLPGYVEVLFPLRLAPGREAHHVYPYDVRVDQNVDLRFALG